MTSLQVQVVESRHLESKAHTVRNVCASLELLVTMTRVPVSRQDEKQKCTMGQMAKMPRNNLSNHKKR